MRKSLLIVIIAICFISGCSINKGNTTKTESGLDVPIVEVKNEEDKIEIARIVFEEYLKLTKEYKIKDINVLENVNSEEYRIEITYDLQSIDGYVTVFETGNGEIKNDNWVKGKYQIVDIKKIGKNKYTILEMYTG